MSQPDQTPRSSRRREPDPKPLSSRRRKWKRIGRDALAALMLIAAIGYTASVMKPVYAGRAPVVGEVIRAVAPPTQAPAPTPTPIEPGSPLADSVARIEASPDFADQKRRFASDLVRTGRMSQERADSIAHYAVREAFLRGVPPAVIFGVMLTENARFISHAQSNVGAVGLMQVYPKYWLKDLSKKFKDPNIATDSTNLRYGVFILEHYLKPRSKKAQSNQHVIATQPGVLMKGLLRYNGCVRGTNTPRCHTYPNKVQKFVERDAQALCGDKNFYQCIAQPFMAGLLGKTSTD
jgi:soluble lytic murein transglycosylase-like protein